MTARRWDLFCNGYELCSGAIRNHKAEIMPSASSKRSRR